MPRPTPTQLVLYAALAVCVVVLGLRALSRDATGEAVPVPTAPSVVREAPKAAVVVHVVGAVREPGLYRVRDGARVADAISRAGGASGRAALDGVNLAAKVADGQQVVVPRRGASAGASAAPAAAAGGASGAPSAPISLSSATLEQLDTLAGVGPATAQKILDHREANGGFSSVDDLAQVPGIGPKKLEALRGLVTP